MEQSTEILLEGQVNIFDYLNQEIEITNPIRLIELFGGVGSQAMALRNIGAKFEHYRLVEFDKYPVASYNAIHGTNFEPTDITKIGGSYLGIEETEKYTYIMTYSFPCQDLSVAGKQRGMEKGSGTRSGLLWEVERLLNETEHLPQVLVMENVPQVHGKKNIDDFNKWIKFLESKGYTNTWQDLNAKDFEIPQNRNRCFMVSILGDYKYEFPKGKELTLRLKDVLENEVDEKFYIKNKQIKNIDLSNDSGDIKRVGRTISGGERSDILGTDGISSCLSATEYKQPKQILQVGNIMQEKNFTNPQCGRVYDDIGISQTLNTMGGGNRQPMIITPILGQTEDGVIVRNANLKGYDIANEGDSINLEQPSSKTRRGRVGHGVSQTLTTSCNQATVEPTFRIRKLTPKECWRLMGFKDDDFEKAQKVNSNTQLYKQAGNSIVVNALEAIFKNLNIKQDFE